MTLRGFIVLSVATGLGLAFILLGVMYGIATVGEERFNLFVGILAAPVGFALAVLLIIALQYLFPGSFR